MKQQQQLNAVCFMLCIYSLVFLDYQKYYLLIMNYSIITPCLSLSINCHGVHVSKIVQLEIIITNFFLL